MANSMGQYEHFKKCAQYKSGIKRILFKIGLISFKAVNGWAPDCIIELFRYSNHERSPVLLLPKVVSNVGRRCFRKTNILIEQTLRG